MSRNILETVMGAVVLAVAGGFLAFAYESGNVKSVEGYPVKAAFDNVGGVSSGSDVRIGGVKVGVISGLDLDPKNYRAVATLQIKNGIGIPVDSSAAIVSDGLIGTKYVAIEPGGEDVMLKAGQSLAITQSSVSLETLIGKMVFNDEKKPPAAPPATPAPAPADAMPPAGGAAH